MLLYAIYTPDKTTSWNHEKIYAFASIERFVDCMRYINDKRGDRGFLAGGSGTLRPITREEAMETSSIATLVADTMTFEGPSIMISENGVRDNWDGHWREITLVENVYDERIPHDVTYA